MNDEMNKEELNDKNIFKVLTIIIIFITALSLYVDGKRHNATEKAKLEKQIDDLNYQIDVINQNNIDLNDQLSLYTFSGDDEIYIKDEMNGTIKDKFTTISDLRGNEHIDIIDYSYNILEGKISGVDQWYVIQAFVQYDTIYNDTELGVKLEDPTITYLVLLPIQDSSRAPMIFSRGIVTPGKSALYISSIDDASIK